MAYIDKINPDILQGRIVVAPDRLILKNPSAPTVKTPLSQRCDDFFDYLTNNEYPARDIDTAKETYAAIDTAGAAGNVREYNRLYSGRPSYKHFLARWLVFDLYGILPGSPKICSSSYDALCEPFRELIDKCMRAAKESGVSDLTISVEASIATSFLTYLQKHGVQGVEDITEQLVRSYPAERHCGPNIPYRIGLFLQRYAVRSGNAALDKKCIYFPREKMMRHVYEAFTGEDRRRFEDFLLSPECSLSKRDRAVCVLMLYTGMRSKDVRELRLENIDWNHRCIRFKQGKTGVEVLLPLRPVVGNCICEYVTGERPKDGSALCFISPSKRNGSYPHVNVADIVNAAYDKAGIRHGDIRRGTHLLRHSLADEMMSSGSDITVVAKMLGHLHPNTTLGYLSANIEQLRTCALSIEKYPVNHKLYRHE